MAPPTVTTAGARTARPVAAGLRVPVAAAASPVVRDALDGPARPMRLLARFPGALYLASATGPDPLVLAVVTPAAVRLPCALVADRLPAGDRAVAGGGALRFAGADLRVTRTHCAALRARPPRRELLSGLHVEPTGLGVPVPARPLDHVDRLLGAGPGLTPAGDDLLAGFLATSAAYGRPCGAQVLAALRAGATTTLSAALLRHAARGEGIPQLGALLAALSGRGRLDAALAALLAVGHTSGRALALGALLAAREAHP